ncbi:MAG: helix-turn-helix transcriptional regulator [Clostridium sp.]|uniref:helix-turn-helix transcriptional regulator n=1 Tax=Clostridium sp. TaxID=1506 RepID=UPI002FC963F9
MALTMGEKIRILIKRKKITISELANSIGTTNQNLSNKLTRDNFSEKELQQIAEALGCKFEGFFVFEDCGRI